MMLPDWAIFVLGMITFHILKGLWLIVETEVRKYREKRFLKFVQVHFPNHEKITFVSMVSPDRRAFAKMKREIKEHYDIDLDDGDEDPSRPKLVTPLPTTKQR
jgi:hypothetical protein